MAQSQQPIDLKTVGAQTEGATPLEIEQSFKTEPYHLARERENIRGQIALWLIVTLVGVIALVAFTAVIATLACLTPDGKCTTEAFNLPGLRVVVELVLTPLVGLVGAVTGFYFGEKSAQPAPPTNGD